MFFFFFGCHLFGSTTHIPRTSPMALAQHQRSLLSSTCRCDPFASNANADHISPACLVCFFSDLFLFPLFSSSSTLCHFIPPLSCFQARFSMSALWWQWSLDWNCKLLFLGFYFIFYFFFYFFIVAFLWRVFFRKQEFTHTIYVNIWTHLHRSAYVCYTINGFRFFFLWQLGQFSGSKQLSNNTNQTQSRDHKKLKNKKKEEAQSENYASVQQKKEITHRHGW